MNFNINYPSLQSICKTSQQVMIYGWQHCMYDSLYDKLSVQNPVIKKVFDYRMGSWSSAGKEHRITTLEGKKMQQIEYLSIIGKKHLPRICKSALVNIVLENCNRNAENLPLIPLIFCMDIDANPYPLNPLDIASRQEELNRRITFKELRRCYKLCNLDEKDFKSVAEIAKKTFKFVKLSRTGNGQEHQLQLMDPFWEVKDWENSWEKRERTPKTSQFNKSTKSTTWQSQLQTLWNEFLASHPDVKEKG